MFLLSRLLLVGLGGWRALSGSHDRAVTSLQRAADLRGAVDSARSAQVEFKIQVQEWKNTLLRSKDSESLERYRSAFVKGSEATQAELKKLQASLARLGIATPLVDDAIATQVTLVGNYLSALKQYDVATPDASAHTVDALVKGMDREPTKKIDDIVAFINEQAHRSSEQMLQEDQTAYRRATIGMLITVLVTLAAGVGAMLWLIRSITVPLAAAVGIAQTVAHGDLRVQVAVTSKDEVGELLGALKQMSGNLAHIVDQVRIGTNAIADASTEIATGNLDLSSRTEEQAASLEETASSMLELTETVKKNNGNAGEASRMADAASSVALKGGEAVAQMVQTMGSINESSRQIVDIIGVIDGIAFQTNILALNAAVEAARAGEQGRGFAVVASEVRNLAQRSASAAREIKQLIGDSVERVEAGSRLAGQAGVTMEQVVSSVQQVTAIIGEISVASSEQQDGIEQISTAINQMDGVTQQNAALVEQAAAAADALQHQAASLAQAVSIFKLGGEAHGAPPRAAAPALALT